MINKRYWCKNPFDGPKWINFSGAPIICLIPMNFRWFILEQLHCRRLIHMYTTHMFRSGPGLFLSDMEYQFVGLFLNVPVRHVIADVATDIQKQVCLLLHWSDNRSLLPMHCTLFYKHNCICHYIDLQINIITYR